MKRTVFLIALFCTTAAEAASWPDTRVARVEALALLQTLNADLLSHDSATLTLDRWCADHHLAEPARVTAERVQGADKPPAPEQLKILRVGAATELRYRRVKLACGGHVLSEADNWYVPAKLTPDMNTQLETTDTAFGRVVQDLHFQRHTLSATLLWEPLPKGWEMQARSPETGADAALAMPDHVLEHKAVLTLPDGTPFSEVVETYTSAVLDFPDAAP